jgi:ABC-type uncharacterized transport system involved in gliding motility auxiliary subunit
MSTTPGTSPRSAEGALKETTALATIGLVVGVLGGTALVFGIVLYALDPKVAPLAIANVASGIVALGFYGITNWRSLTRAFGGRSTTFAFLEVLIVIGVLGGVLAVNVFASSNTTEWDLTQDSLYTLTEQSRVVARKLQKEVKIVGFFRPNETQRARLVEVVELYQRETDKITLELISPDSAPPAVLKQYQMSSTSPRIVLATTNGQMTKVKLPAEETLTNALLKIADRPPKKAYFIAGHGGPNITDGKSESGYLRAAGDLRDEGYEVEELSMIGRDTVPKDSTLLIVGPTTSALLPNEVEAIKAWVDIGGRLLVMLEPGQNSGLQPIFDAFFVEVGDDLVVDPNPASKALGFGPDAPTVQTFEAHPITDKLEGTAALFYTVRSVSPKLGAGDTKISTLVRTSAQSWGEKNWAGAEEVERDELDVPGPVPIAVAVSRNAMSAIERTSDESRLVVFGDGNFADNRFGPISGNGDLFLNAVNWLAGEEDLITIRPKVRGSSRLSITEEQQYGIMFFSVNLLPLVIIGFGFSVWAVRRRK